VGEGGKIDIALNATSFLHDQGTMFADLDVEYFKEPVVTFLPSLFNSSKAVLPFIGGGLPWVFLTLTTPAGRAAVPGHLGYSFACAGIEAFTRVLAAELGASDTHCVPSSSLLRRRLIRPCEKHGRFRLRSASRRSTVTTASATECVMRTSEQDLAAHSFTGRLCQMP
jgi:hypothetical protein